MTDQDGGRSPSSTIAASEMDDHRTGPSSPNRADPRTSLQHVLGDTDSVQNTPPRKRGLGEITEDEELKPAPSTAKSKSGPKGRKGASATKDTNPASSYTGHKVRHLKKDDGEPLWRSDIQYDFLKMIFDDETKVFTNSYEPGERQTFADLYIDAMARSSKTSKILRDKLLSEHEPAKNMAMVCLLVNLGRMNTTLNFFPEMRAQLRTYHAIPSLQAQQDPNSYKQLQDAPRLKSILKGASEDRPEPNSIEKIKGSEIPRTNPVNLIFVLAQFAVMVTELHFPPGFDFYDLIMRNTLSSKSRARAFLWLIWHYLESDFTEEGAAENPFGPGVDYGTGEEASQEAYRSKVDLEKGVANQGVPQFDVLSEEEAALENVDTAAEVEYGEAKMRERKRIIEADQAAFTADFGPPKRGPKPKLNLLPEEGASPSLLRARSTKYESDLDSTRSTPPPRVPNMRIQNVLNGSRSGRGSLKHQMVDSSSPAPSGLSAVAVPEGPSRRSRPLTAHQLAVERNRNQRVNYILSRGLRKAHHHARKARKVEGAILRAVQRTAHLHEEDMLADSESEESMMKPRGSFRERGLGGLIQLNTEEDDFGEELASYAAAFRRAGRRLDRWDGSGGRELGVMGTARIEKKEPVGDETEDEAAGEGEGEKDAAHKDGVEDTIMEEDLDDMEKEILGLGSDDEGPDERDEDLDDMDKEILGIGGDETEEEEQGSDGGMDVD